MANDLVVTGWGEGGQLWDPKYRVMTSYDLSTHTGKVLTQRAMVGCDTRIEGLTPAVGLIEHVVCHRITISGPDLGEEIQAVRVVLVDTEGRRYAGVSDGVLSAIMQISLLCGPPPWKGGLKLRCVTGRSRRGFQYHTLEMEE